MRPTHVLIALVGAGEYLDTMDAIDLHLLAATGKDRPRVACLPTASSLEGDETIDRWAEMGVAHFARLGAEPLVARITDRACAEDPACIRTVDQADLIYVSGGNPLHLARVLDGSSVWRSIRAAMARGVIYAGCSAGAMVLGASVPDVDAPGLDLHPGLGVLPGVLVMPHFDQLESYQPGTTALVQSKLGSGLAGLGIDEHTALIGSPGGEWRVMGPGRAHTLGRDAITSFAAGETVRLPAGGTVG